MKRRLWFLLDAALFSGISCYALYYGHRVSGLPRDQAAWLRREFALTDAQTKTIAMLESDYRPACAARCLEYMNAQRDLSALTADARAWSPEIGAAVEKLYEVQMTCHREMLRHAYAVSAVMSPESGRRYLAMMEARVSSSMSADMPSAMP